MYKYEVPARLHITLCDMNGNLGRINGGLGFSINEPKLIFYVEKSNTIKISYVNVEDKEQKKYIYDETNVELGIYKDKAKKPIGIQNLSSGEKQIISVFSKLYIENIEKCIILFDEPELSLSIKWQNMFLPDVVNSGKCSTLIAVTHSPFIFDNEFDDLAKDMGNCLSENE